MVRAAAWETLFHYPYFSLEVTIILYYNPNTFRRCDHRSDEKKVIKVTIFYLHLTQTKDVIFHPENPVNPDSNPITGK